MNDDLERPKMQTTEQNSSKLTIQISPSFFLLFFGIVFTLTGLFLLYQSTRTTTFTCHRQETGQGQCELSESTPLGTKTQTISVNEVHGATVERPNISDTGPKSDRVNIITSNGDIPLTSYYGGLEDNYEIADQINAFVSDPSMPTLTIQKGPSAIGYAASSFFIFVGIAAMLNIALCDTYTFDKTTNTMTWTRQGITGSRVRAYSLDQIKGVQSKIVNYSSGSSPRRLIMRQYCRLYLVMTSGKPLHLTRYKLLTKAEAEHYARSIQEILGSVDMHSYEKGASSSSPIDVDVLQKKTPPFQSQPSPSRPQWSRSSATRRIRHMLMAALAFCGVVFVGYRFLRLSQETSANTNSSSPASSSLEHNFELWEWHSDDTVRVVDVIAKEGAIGSEGWTDLLWLRQGDQILSLDFIGGKMVKPVRNTETYGGVTYLTTRYKLKVTAEQYGHEIRVARPPHLHLQGTDRLISIGADPHPRPKTVAVAIPSSATINKVYDYQPYKQITLAQWNIFYYSMTDIQSHVSIHINYRLGDDVPSLDWHEVEAAR